MLIYINQCFYFSIVQKSTQTTKNGRLLKMFNIIFFKQIKENDRSYLQLINISCCGNYIPIIYNQSLHLIHCNSIQHSFGVSSSVSHIRHSKCELIGKLMHK